MQTEYTITLKAFICFLVFKAVLQVLLNKQFCNTIELIDPIIKKTVIIISPLIFIYYTILYSA